MDNNNALEIQRRKSNCLTLCRKLINALDNNEDDVNSFFGGDLQKAYIIATDKARSKAINVQAKIRRL